MERVPVHKGNKVRYNEERLKSLIARMTLDEKLAQLGSYWIFELQTRSELDPAKMADKLKHGIGQISRLGGASTYDPRAAARASNRLQKFLVEETRLGIPAIIHEECCAGAMVRGGTMFPQMLGLAATFQPELARAMTGLIRKQLTAVGARQGLAPVMDVARDPRWGRIEETFGEDPTLVSQFGAAYIQGLQGDDLAEGVLATGKHFLGHSFSQGGLNCGPVHVGWRELYEVFLPPFQAAIRDARLGAMMNAYPELDGEVVAASRRILTDLLRRELGFSGVVVSDYEAVIMLHNFHHVAEDPSTAAKMALEAGIDVELPTWDCYREPLRAALEAGQLSLEAVDLAVYRHLRMKAELGLFDHPYVNEDRAVEVFEEPQNRELALEIARRSIVLLKNDGTLPLKKTLRRIAVIGPNADDGRNQLGDYSYPSMMELVRQRELQDPRLIDQIAASEMTGKVVTILDGIRRMVSADTELIYAKGCEVQTRNRDGFAEAVSAAQNSDVVVLVLGDRSGLTPECTTGETRDCAELRLPGVQEELAREVIAAGKPVVIVLVSGRPYAIPWLSEHANAILEAWLPGEQGGAAVAEILFGEFNPGGKLPVTFPRSAGQIPVYHYSKPSGTGSFWYRDYVDGEAAPLFPFGHGLSYTTFTYSELAIEPREAAPGEQVNISLNVMNTGQMAGDEVVQLYIRDEYASVPRPAKELKGFIRLSLQPGETRTVTFHLPVNQLAFFNPSLDLVVEPGKVQVMVGSSSEDIRLRGEFVITGGAKIPLAERVFCCPVELREDHH